jgi:CRISPR type III-A-associated RAMP protein Csm4
MHPGLVVKLRPSGPWRIGPDSGARNRVDVIYHSDSLYSAVTSAMARLGSLEEWLDATGRPQEPAAAPAVCFSSCFPFLDDTRYVVPPRTVWPPVTQAISARVRWKSARFVPLDMVQAILAGRRLDENYWTIDGPSECLTPAGGPGPFRTAVRWSAAVDRLTGATERHATACLEFRPGCGLWTVASFADEAARDRWQEPVKAAFRLLADSGFGGERSRGWGRSETPEFEEGTLPEMILPAIREAASQAVETAPPAPEPASAGAGGQAEAPAPQGEPPLEELAAEPAEAEASLQAPSEIAPLLIESAEAIEAPEAAPAGAGGQAQAPAPQDEPPSEVVAAEPAEAEASVQAPPEAPPLPVEPADANVVVPEQPSPAPADPGDGSPPEDAEACEAGASAGQPEPIAPEPESPAPAGPTDETVCPTLPQTGGAGGSACQPNVPELPAPPVPAAAQAEAPAPPPPAPAFADARPHWLLSLFAPAPADAVDWKRGDYALLSRGGRVESPAGSGELKKQVHMVAEGSVLLAAAAPRGSAADVAPDGFPHPVYRAGFAVSVPLPKVS